MSTDDEGASALFGAADGRDATPGGSDLARAAGDGPLATPMGQTPSTLMGTSAATGGGGGSTYSEDGASAESKEDSAPAESKEGEGEKQRRQRIADCVLRKVAAGMALYVENGSTEGLLEAIAGLLHGDDSDAVNFPTLGDVPGADCTGGAAGGAGGSGAGGAVGVGGVAPRALPRLPVAIDEDRKAQRATMAQKLKPNLFAIKVSDYCANKSKKGFNGRLCINTNDGQAKFHEVITDFLRARTDGPAPPRFSEFQPVMVYPPTISDYQLREATDAATADRLKGAATTKLKNLGRSSDGELISWRKLKPGAVIPAKDATGVYEWAVLLPVAAEEESVDKPVWLRIYIGEGILANRYGEESNGTNGGSPGSAWSRYLRVLFTGATNENPVVLGLRYLQIDGCHKEIQDKILEALAYPANITGQGNKSKGANDGAPQWIPQGWDCLPDGWPDPESSDGEAKAGT